MEKRDYLNEEKYQKNKSKVITIGTIVLIIGLLIGGGLIATGVIKNNQAQLTPEEIYSFQAEINSFKSQLASLKAQKNKEFMSAGHSENYYKLGNEIDKVETKINELETSMNEDTSWLVVFYILGGFIVVVTFIISGIIYTTANSREINAFYVQQQIPIAQEGIEKMAPSVGKVAKEIAKGIKEGIEDNH